MNIFSAQLLILKYSLRNLLMILLLFWMSGSQAQSDSSSVKLLSTRSSYIIDLTNHINITPFIHNAANGFELRGKKNLRYDPNESIGVGLRLSHKWLILAVGYGPKNIQEKRRGSTDYLNITLNSYGKRMGMDAYYLAYTGYYISNPAGIPNLAEAYGKRFPILPGLSTLNIGCNVFYIFNHQNILTVLHLCKTNNRNILQAHSFLPHHTPTIDFHPTRVLCLLLPIPKFLLNRALLRERLTA